MNLNIDFEPGEEELVVTLDDAAVLKVSLGQRGELILNDTFKNIEDTDPDLYAALKKISRELFTLSVV
jgi:hypothetical protein